MSSSSLPYWTCVSLSIIDVKTEFLNRNAIQTMAFSSEEDPQHPRFHLVVGCGTKTTDWLGAAVFPIDHPVTYTSLNITLFDNNWRHLLKREMWRAEWDCKPVDSESFENKIDCLYGWEKFYQVDLLENVTWRLTCELEYHRLPLSPPKFSNVSSL